MGDCTTDVSSPALQHGVDLLTSEAEPTLVVIPDAVRLPQADCMAVQRAMLAHCGRMGNRMALLDIWGGWQHEADNGCVSAFRQGIGTTHLAFGAAYYPWLHTTIVPATDIGFDHITPASRVLLADLIQHELGLDKPLQPHAPILAQQQRQAQAQLINAINQDFSAGSPPPSATAVAIAIHKAQVNQSLRALSPLFKTVLTAAQQQLNLLPPSAGMAGVYTQVDNTRAVWHAPANVSLSLVASTAVPLTDAAQEDLNVHPQGLSINAIRNFTGQGVLVWGARTLDSNNPDRRYINIQRTRIMLAESCRLAVQAYVFEPNASNTWVTIRSLLDNYLTSVWQRGGLAGASPREAFSVQVGLGDTMTQQDILDGRLRVTVLVALTRPAEFIEITFEQTMPVA